MYRKKDGIFIRLPPGRTYQLNCDDFEPPVLVKRNSHITRVGPLTLVTLEPGKLCGAYKHRDGAFEEFTDMSKEYVLHEKVLVVALCPGVPNSFVFLAEACAFSRCGGRVRPCVCCWCIPNSITMAS